jgi:DNA-binding PadR family transcriptional regulator
MLYSEPARLAAHGLLQTQEENKGRRRRTYSITDEGRSVLTEWLKTPTDDVFQIRNLAEIKLFFAELVDHRHIVSLAERQIEAHRKRLASYEEMKEKFGKQAHLRLRMIPLQLGMELERTALEFWDSLLKGKLSEP